MVLFRIIYLAKKIRKRLIFVICFCPRDLSTFYSLAEKNTRRQRCDKMRGRNPIFFRRWRVPERSRGRVGATADFDDRSSLEGVLGEEEIQRLRLASHHMKIKTAHEQSYSSHKRNGGDGATENASAQITRE